MLRSVSQAFVGEVELTERQGSLLLAFSGVLFSVTAIALAGVEAATDFQFLTYRGLSTFLAMVVLVLVRRGGRPVRFDTVTPVAWLAGFVLASANLLYIFALSGTSAATTLSLLATAPVAAAILGWVFLREIVNSATIIATVITIVGVVITVGAGLEVGSDFGLVFALALPFAVGSYSVLTRSIPLVDPVVPAMIAGGALTVFAGIAALIEGGIGVSLRDLLMAVISGGIALGIGLPMFNLGHRSVTAARVPLLLMTEIVLAPLWVWIWPGETPSAQTLLGGAIILAAVIWLLLRPVEAKPATSLG